MSRLVYALTCMLLSILLPVTVAAQAEEPVSILEDSVAVPSLLITEVQTESDEDANQEFVELANVSETEVVLDGIVIEYRSASGASWSVKAILLGTLPSNHTVVISSQGYQPDVSHSFFKDSGGQLAAAGGNIRLYRVNDQLVYDTVAWGSGEFGEGQPAAKASKGLTYQRKKAPNFIDTDDNFNDFSALESSAHSGEIVVEPVDEPPIDDPVDDPVDIPEEPPVEDPVDDPAEEGPNPLILEPIRINEFMVNPVSPETDANDEWIEFYNPNNTIFDLTGFMVQTGNSFNYKYIFADTIVEPFGYYVLRSSLSGLALSNSSGAVRLLDQDQVPVGFTVPYDEVEEGSSYNYVDGVWQWSITPTPLAANVIVKQPAPAPKVTKIASSKAAAAPKKATAVKAATAKTSTAKTATTKKTTAKATTSTTTEIPPVVQQSRPSLLAGLAVLAVLYGLYEYKDDLIACIEHYRRNVRTRRTNS